LNPFEVYDELFLVQTVQQLEMKSDLQQRREEPPSVRHFEPIPYSALRVLKFPLVGQQEQMAVYQLVQVPVQSHPSVGLRPMMPLHDVVCGSIS
jgi:hypothetical protein